MKRFLIIIGICLFSNAAFAESNFYGILSAGYAQSEVDDFELDKASYKFGIGYELNRQWYIEAGYQSLGEVNAGEQAELTGSDVAEFSAVYLAALGKASGQFGELFYRAGVMRVDASVQSATALSCPAGPTVCRIDNSLLAGVLGLGFDFYIHHSTMLRFEVEYIKGEQDYTAAAAYLGLRLNF